MRSIDIKYINTIDATNYNLLRKSVGWNPLDISQAQKGIDNSYIVCAMFNDITAGVVRVISDGGYIALIADVMVLPEFQGIGIGTSLINHALDYIKSTITDEQCVFVSLMSTQDKEGFYEKFGFDRRPNNELGSGMSLWIGKY